MKIIGKTQNGYIMEATGREVARLIGYYYEGIDGAEHLEVGMTIEVSKMYQQLYDLSCRRRELEKVQQELRRAADLLTPVIPVFPGPEDILGGEKNG